MSSLLPVPVPDVVRNALASAVAVASSGEGESAAGANSGHLFAGVSEGVDGLDNQERAVLDSFLGEVTVQLRERLIERLQVLV